MPDLDVIDSLIAIVVVLLVLSLIVQSIQAALKKLLKIRSRQIEDSLLDLFENALDAPSPGTKGMMASSPVLRAALFRKHPVENAAPPVRELFDAVREKFGEVGRVGQSGRVVLDSISKEDLLKVMARVDPGTLLPGFVAKLEDACKQVLALEKTLAAVGSAGLSGESAARLASLRQTVAPLFNDVRAVFDGQTLQANVLIGDVVRLRAVRLDDLLAALADLQKSVDREIAEAKQAGQPTALLDVASRALTQVGDELAELASKFDAALAPLRARLRSVETWFDTVMQSFEERYSRGMRTWCFVLSLIVVVASNANFFAVFQTILLNDAVRAGIVREGERRVPPASGTAATEAPEETGAPVSTEPAAGAAPAAASGPSGGRVLLASMSLAAAAPAVTEPPTATTEPPAATEPPAVGTEAPAETEPAAGAAAPAEEPTQTVQEVVAETQREVGEQLDSYADLGFEPLDREAFERSFATPGKGLYTLAGWLLMALLLSVGAPFWQDTLESLFGIKNLLRKRSDIQPVEQRSGEGYPKAT